MMEMRLFYIACVSKSNYTLKKSDYIRMQLTVQIVSKTNTWKMLSWSQYSKFHYRLFINVSFFFFQICLQPQLMLSWKGFDGISNNEIERMGFKSRVSILMWQSSLIMYYVLTCSAADLLVLHLFDTKKPSFHNEKYLWSHRLDYGLMILPSSQSQTYVSPIAPSRIEAICPDCYITLQTWN